MWRLASSEANSNTINRTGLEVGRHAAMEAEADASVAASHAWIWVDLSMAWVLSPLTGAGLELSLWWSVVPSWLCVTMAAGYALRAEEVGWTRCLSLSNGLGDTKNSSIAVCFRAERLGKTASHTRAKIVRETGIHTRPKFSCVSLPLKRGGEE